MNDTIALGSIREQVTDSSVMRIMDQVKVEDYWDAHYVQVTTMLRLDYQLPGAGGLYIMVIRVYTNGGANIIRLLRATPAEATMVGKLLTAYAAGLGFRLVWVQRRSYA